MYPKTKTKIRFPEEQIGLGSGDAPTGVKSGYLVKEVKLDNYSETCEPSDATQYRLYSIIAK